LELLAEIEELIQGCKQNNRRAQEKLYKSYYQAMMGLCLRYTKNADDALQALNTGFFKVFKNIHSFKLEKASFYTWARTIIINSCLDLINTNSNIKPTIEIELAADANVPPDAISSMTADEILQLVRSLPPATQAVFNLYVIEGYTHVNIAAMLGISEGTSKWHLSEARKKLQVMIKEQKV
jgi:RNA polymerase sigma factor (sigma-70 family)